MVTYINVMSLALIGSEIFCPKIFQGNCCTYKVLLVVNCRTFHNISLIRVCSFDEDQKF